MSTRPQEMDLAGDGWVMLCGSLSGSGHSNSVQKKTGKFPLRRKAASKLRSVKSVTDASEQSTCKMIPPSGSMGLVSLGRTLGSGISLLAGHNAPEFLLE